MLASKFRWADASYHRTKVVKKQYANKGAQPHLSNSLQKRAELAVDLFEKWNASGWVELKIVRMLVFANAMKKDELTTIHVGESPLRIDQVHQQGNQVIGADSGLSALVDVIIPALNEEQSLPLVLKALPAVRRVIVVDNVLPRPPAI